MNCLEKKRNNTLAHTYWQGVCAYTIYVYVQLYIPKVSGIFCYDVLLKFSVFGSYSNFLLTGPLGVGFVGRQPKQIGEC